MKRLDRDIAESFFRHMFGAIEPTHRTSLFDGMNQIGSCVILESDGYKADDINTWWRPGLFVRQDYIKEIMKPWIFIVHKLGCGSIFARWIKTDKSGDLEETVPTVTKNRLEFFEVTGTKGYFIATKHWAELSAWDTYNIRVKADRSELVIKSGVEPPNQLE